MEPYRIHFRTRSPLWTGGPDQRAGRVHETGILGSLRWWYEAMVRGLGGFVGDPTASGSGRRAEFDTPAYVQAQRQGRDREAALAAGLRGLGPVEYLFGATGWARLFRLSMFYDPPVPLHFRSTLSTNLGWLGKVFGDQEASDPLADRQVVYGQVEMRVTLRRRDEAYALGQLGMLLRFAEAYGGLGARQQHGFGQIGDLELPEEMADADVEGGLRALKARIDGGIFHPGMSYSGSPYDLRRYVHHLYWLPESALTRFTQHDAHAGDKRKLTETDYIPCAFDLRYKGDGLGMREWLRRDKGWVESDDPRYLGPLDKLMGPRSEWKDAKGEKQKVRDENRTASRVYFGMPVRDGDGYELAVYGFAPPGVCSVCDLDDLFQEYMQKHLGVAPVRVTWGRGLIP